MSERLVLMFCRNVRLVFPLRKRSFKHPTLQTCEIIARSLKVQLYTVEVPDLEVTGSSASSPQLRDLACSSAAAYETNFEVSAQDSSKSLCGRETR